MENNLNPEKTSVPANLPRNPMIEEMQALLRKFAEENAKNKSDASDQMAKDASFKLVLTDMRMPVLDGEGLIREIRDKVQWKGLPVYAATAPGAVSRSFFKTRRCARAGGRVRTATIV